MLRYFARSQRQGEQRRAGGHPLGWQLSGRFTPAHLSARVFGVWELCHPSTVPRSPGKRNPAIGPGCPARLRLREWGKAPPLPARPPLCPQSLAEGLPSPVPAAPVSRAGTHFTHPYPGKSRVSHAPAAGTQASDAAGMRPLLQGVTAGKDTAPARVCRGLHRVLGHTSQKFALNCPRLIALNTIHMENPIISPRFGRNHGPTVSRSRSH